MSGKEKTNGSLAMAPRVITIPAASQENTRKLRVAAYARVSSNSEDQKHSFAAQNAYFSKFITDNPDWELADIYADQGITGTSIDKREDFQRMMEDCRGGKIDRILVKSSSRFARNTKESLEAVRELAALGVSVYFEEQNIDTAQVSGEVLIAMFAALAQRESEAISERMRWSYQVRMQSGKFIPSSTAYGYRLNGNQTEIVPEEAEIIRKIFADYLAGKGIQSIADDLNRLNIPLRSTSKTQHWRCSTIEYILSNERYIGDSLWQKTYQIQTLPRKPKKNKGEKIQYFLEQTHPAIIDRETFQKAQRLRASRVISKNSSADPIRQKLVCGVCGSPYRIISNQGMDSYECQAKNRGTAKCETPRLSKTQIHKAFLSLYYRIKHYGVGILTQLISDLHAARTGSLLWSENIVEINKQISDIASQERLLTQLKQQGSVDPDIFISRSNLLAERRRELKLQKERILRSEEDHTIQQTQDLLDVLESGPDWLDDFDEQLFSDMVEKIVVVDNETLRFRLLNGLEVTEKIERTQR